MNEPLSGVGITIVTAFPDLVRSYLSTSVLGRGIDSGKLDASVVDLRDHAEGHYRQIDDYSFGSGGMVLMAAPLEAALDAASTRDTRYVVYPSPQGVPLHQALVEDLRQVAANKRLIIVCGHYEGLDERFVERNVDLEISLGDFVLTGGELPALAIIDALSRLVKGVVGKERAVVEDSFYAGLLDHPHYTRPAEYEGLEVPAVLLSGNQAEIERYRREESVVRTIARRPDVIARSGVMPWLLHGVYVIQLHHPVLDRKGKRSTTAITGLDLHDIARACRTYGVRKYLIVTPLEQQREMVKTIAAHWTKGYGAGFNADRAEAMRAIKTFSELGHALSWIAKREHAQPFTLATTARKREDACNWTGLKRRILTEKRPVAFLFGTGGGLHEEILDDASAVLAPIYGGIDEYNHLSIRSAVSIVLDRFFGFR